VERSGKTKEGREASCRFTTERGREEQSTGQLAVKHSMKLGKKHYIHLPSFLRSPSQWSIDRASEHATTKQVTWCVDFSSKRMKKFLFFTLMEEGMNAE